MGIVDKDSIGIMEFASLAFIFCSAFFAVVHGACPSGWTRYDTSCYHISRDTATWAEAMKMCEIHGSVLAAIETTAEDQYVKTILAAQRHTNSFWLGGSDWDNEGEWKWAPSEIPFNFTDWHHGQPDNRGHIEHCLSAHRIHRYQFSDDNCQSAQHYLCEKSDTDQTDESLLG